MVGRVAYLSSGVHTLRRPLSEPRRVFICLYPMGKCRLAAYVLASARGGLKAAAV